MTILVFSHDKTYMFPTIDESIIDEEITINLKENKIYTSPSFLGVDLRLYSFLRTYILTIFRGKNNDDKKIRDHYQSLFEEHGISEKAVQYTDKYSIRQVFLSYTVYTKRFIYFRCRLRIR